MSYAFPPEIKYLIDQNMATGIYSSEDDVLQAALHVLSDYNATVSDIRQGVDDYQKGEGESLTSAFDQVRRQLGTQS